MGSTNAQRQAELRARREAARLLVNENSMFIKVGCSAVLDTPAIEQHDELVVEWLDIVVAVALRLEHYDFGALKVKIEDVVVGNEWTNASIHYTSDNQTVVINHMHMGTWEIENDDLKDEIVIDILKHMQRVLKKAVRAEEWCFGHGSVVASAYQSFVGFLAAPVVNCWLPSCDFTEAPKIIGATLRDE